MNRWDIFYEHKISVTIFCFLLYCWCMQWPVCFFCFLLVTFFLLVGFKPVKHMVFSGLYPADGSDFDALNHAIERLTCNDASVSVTKETSTALGLGFRFGIC